MANRFWVGGTGLWSGSNTVNWSATSGGTSGASVPVATDDVYFDANSGGGTCTVSTASQGGQSLSFTGVSGTSNYTGNLIQSGLGSLQVAGNLTYSPSMTTINVSVLLNGTSTHTITTNGIFDSLVNYINILTISGAGTTVYGLAGKVYMATFSHIFGTFNTNNYDIYANTVSGTLANAKFLNLGSSTIFINGTGASTYVPQNTTINYGTSTLRYISTNNNNITIAFGGGTYYNIWFDRGASIGTMILNTTGTATFLGSFIDTGTAAHILQFQGLRTWNFGDFRVRGTAGNIISVVSNGASLVSFNKSPLGLVSCNYLQVTTINAVNASTWYAGANSTLTNTAGWIATPPPPRKLGASGAG